MKTKHNPLDYVGKVFGRWIALEQAPNKGYHTCLLCLCKCGTLRDVSLHQLVSGRSNSCGCGQREATRKACTKHGGARSKEYAVWVSMVRRCHSPGCNKYREYGARGISVCGRWRESFGNFIADMGWRPGPGYSVERIDNNGNYEFSNCRWATALEQAQNREKTHKILIDGEVLSAAEIARRYNVSSRTVITRIFEYGWSPERAVGLGNTISINKCEIVVKPIGRNFIAYSQDDPMHVSKSNTEAAALGKLILGEYSSDVIVPDPGDYGAE